MGVGRCTGDLREVNGLICPSSQKAVSERLWDGDNQGRLICQKQAGDGPKFRSYFHFFLFAAPSFEAWETNRYLKNRLSIFHARGGGLLDHPYFQNLCMDKCIIYKLSNSESKGLMESSVKSLKRRIIPEKTRIETPSAFVPYPG